MVAPVVAMTVWRSLPLLRKFVFGIAFTVFFMGFLFTGVGSGFTGSQQGVQSGEKLTSGTEDEVESTGDCSGIVERARAEMELGVKEVSEDRDKDGRIQQYTNGRIEPWCADFASWVLWQSGNKLNANYTSNSYKPTDPSAGQEPGVSNMQNYFNKNEIYLPPGSEVQPGDMVFYDWRNCGQPGTTHMGIVASYDQNSRTVRTIEGNTGTGVPGGGEGIGSRQINTSSRCITGFGRLRDCQESAVFELRRRPWVFLWHNRGKS
jgi:hypothetical protein